jgi:CheY-like chemotaxis protein
MKTHGGAVTVYSELGKGTVFRLYFPATVESERTASRALRALPSAGGKRVLYIDDDELLVSLVKRKLTRLGYVVCSEQDPRTALAHFREHPDSVDVVVTDLAMPGMRGFDLARELLAIRPDLPVIVTSGYVRPEDQEAAQILGIRELIPKPNTSDDLGTALHHLLRGER